MNYGFWEKLEKPIVAMSPMDGVTDAAYRYICDKYGKPAILFTEFTSVEGIVHGAVKLLNPFIHHETRTPTVAQIYGSNPQSFYDSAFVVCEMGFDGVDINMGCPDHNISKKGCGAGLILTPKIAQEIILAVKKATKDYYDGKNIEDTSLPASIIEWVKEYKNARHTELDSASDSEIPKRVRDDARKHLPVSVKTRIGYEDIVTEDWIKNLLETEPVNITVHGRTLKQMYTGLANWEEIGKAAAIVKNTNTMILGNGDVKSIAEAKEKAKTYNLDGVLIGRASFGNPWLFKEYTPTAEEQFKVAIEHCEAFMKFTPQLHFPSLRKHLAWYTKGIHGSNELRTKLMTANTLDEVKGIFNQFQNSF